MRNILFSSWFSKLFEVWNLAQINVLCFFLLCLQETILQFFSVRKNHEFFSFFQNKKKTSDVLHNSLISMLAYKKVDRLKELEICQSRRRCKWIYIKCRETDKEMFFYIFSAYCRRNACKSLYNLQVYLALNIIFIH